MSKNSSFHSSSTRKLDDLGGATYKSSYSRTGRNVSVTESVTLNGETKSFTRNYTRVSLAGALGKMFFVIIMLVFSVFMFRLFLNAQFSNEITEDNYFEYNLEDNQINNLDGINASSESLFNFFRNMPNRFSSIVNALKQYNVFEAATQNLSDIWLIGTFLNFLSGVWSFLSYVVAAFGCTITCFLDIFKYIFSVESISENVTHITISGLG